MMGDSRSNIECVNITGRTPILCILTLVHFIIVGQQLYEQFMSTYYVLK